MVIKELQGLFGKAITLDQYVLPRSHGGNCVVLTIPVILLGLQMDTAYFLSQTAGKRGCVMLKMCCTPALWLWDVELAKIWGPLEKAVNYKCKIYKDSWLCLWRSPGCPQLRVCNKYTHACKDMDQEIREGLVHLVAKVKESFGVWRLLQCLANS